MGEIFWFKWALKRYKKISVNKKTIVNQYLRHKEKAAPACPSKVARRPSGGRRWQLHFGHCAGASERAPEEVATPTCFPWENSTQSREDLGDGLEVSGMVSHIMVYLKYHYEFITGCLGYSLPWLGDFHGKFPMTNQQAFEWPGASAPTSRWWRMAPRMRRPSKPCCHFRLWRCLDFGEAWVCPKMEPRTWQLGEGPC